MEQIKGTSIPTLPWKNLDKIADLIYFEGPLLSLFKNNRGDNYFYYWCDANETHNRWIILRITDKDLNFFVNKKITLTELITKPSDGFVFTVDIDDNLEYHNIFILSPSALPHSYIPQEDSFYESEVNPLIPAESITKNKQSYRLLLDGAWAFGEFSIVPEVYNQVYAFFYAINQIGQISDNSLKDSFISFPWLGGYSAVNFYNKIWEVIPKDKQPQVSSIQYASPGWIELELNTSIAFLIKNSIAAHTTGYDELDTVYKEIHKDLSKRKLLREAKVSTNNIIPEERAKVKELEKARFKLKKDDLDYVINANQIMAKNIRLNEQVNQINEMTQDPLVTLKILLSFYRRIKILARFQIEGKVQY